MPVTVIIVVVKRGDAAVKVQIHKKKYSRSGCLICGRPVVYTRQSVIYTCRICKAEFEGNAICEAGHYICDGCHASSQADFVKMLAASEEKAPIKLLDMVTGLKNVHMHGPEHHSIVPCVLLTAYHNSGGVIELAASLETAVKRGGQVTGGSCGYWGACGAAVGAGIYASIVTGSNPLNKAVWSIPQLLTAQCLEKIAASGGPRCCKRTSRIAIETAAEFTKEHFGVEMPVKISKCTFYMHNKECLREDCVYYGGVMNAEI